MKAALVSCLLAFAGEHVSLETITPRERYYVGEPIRLTLRIEFDRGFFESSAVQLFQRELDLPLQVEADWLEPPDPAEGPTIALNDSVVRVRSSGEGVLAIEHTRLAREPGELVLAAPRARFAYATEFVEDFIQGRIPADRTESTVEGAARTLTILPLPEEGRPGSFRGAVGRRLAIRADAKPRVVAAGAIVKLTITIEGEGNLGEFAAPRLDDLEGFHVYGVLDEKSPARRVVTYDLAVLDGEVTEVPPIPFSWFDGPRGVYVTTHTDPIPLSVRGREADRAPEPEPRAATWVLVWLGVFLALTLLVWIRTRGQRQGRVDHAARFHARDDVPDAFVDYLAARLGCPAAAVVSPGLATRLTQAGVPLDLAKRVATLVENMVASRYGGAVSDDRAGLARELVDEIENRTSFASESP